MRALTPREIAGSSMREMAADTKRHFIEAASMLCGARTRRHVGRCRAHAMANGRCRLHGGWLRGPGTVDHLRLTLPLAWAARKARQAERKALGLKWFGGRPRKWRLKIATKEGILELMANEIDRLPEAPKGPIETWTPSELLQQAGREGLMRLYKAIKEPREGLPDKLVIHGDNMALGVVKVFRDVWEANLRDRQNTELDEILAKIAREEAKDQKS